LKTLAVIPARYQSTRFPAKMLADLAGQPVVLRTVEQALKAKQVDAVLVATDDERIFNIVEAAGYPVCMTRRDHPSGTDRIVEAVKTLDVDVVVNVQGDEPFMNPEVIDLLILRMQEDDQPEMATACTAITSREDLHSPSVVKVVRDVKGCALYFSRSLIPFARDVEPETLLPDGLYFRHLGIYAYKKSFLESWEGLAPHPLETTEKLEQLRALAYGARIAVIETEQLAPGIDTPEDLERAIHFLNQNTENIL